MPKGKPKSSAVSAAAVGHDIPTYRIDLSLPPDKRYTQLATDFGPKMRALTPMYDDVISSFILNEYLYSCVKFFAKIMLRKVYSREETEELRSISRVSGVEMYLLVALNVFLDSLLGCTSGGVIVRPGSGHDKAERMMHFRTLDWGMSGLRDLVVILEFVRSNENPEEVLGRCVTYAGFT